MVEWRDVPGYEGLYEASSDGYVRKATTHRVKKNSLATTGYHFTILYNQGEGKNHLLHRIIALTFIGYLPEGHNICRHLNGIRTDNRVENLSWGTQSDNIQDAVLHGTHRQVKKTHCPRGHELIGTNLIRKPGHRECRLCHNQLAKERRINDNLSK